MRKLSNDSNLIPVLEEARRVLPLLEARINDLRQGEKQELLLPSSAPNDDGLLIPHSGHGETMSAELLRPALPQSEQEINQEEQIEVRDYSAKKEPANINLLWGG